MEGFDETTYGAAFADVYDDWYGDVSDVDATVSTLAALALDAADGGDADVVELGVGSGRIAVPLAHTPHVRVEGIDTSRQMLDLLTERDHGGLVRAHLGDMVADLPDGPFHLAVVAYNTLFNLTGDGEQQRCFEAVAARLRPGGRFVVEAFVPEDPPRDGDDLSIRSMTADRVVLSVSRHDAHHQRAEGHFVELSASGGVRLRPWSIRYSTPEQLDAMAATAGMSLEHRWRDMLRTPFGGDADRHVSVYRSS